MEPSAAEQLSCKDGIFLAPVIRAYEDDGCIVGPETRLAVSSIKRGIKSLRASDDPYIQGQIGRINKTYFLEDGLWQDADAFTKWKPGRNLLGNLLRANTAQVVEFAELNDGRVRQLQRGLIDDHDELADDALRRTHRLVGSNVLPKSAELLMEQTIDWAGDFTAIGSVEQAANDYVGYCDYDGIGIANLYDFPGYLMSPGVQMKQTVFHEYMHGVGHLQSNKRGLFFGLTTKIRSNYNRWLEEAYVATVAHEAVKPDIKSALVKPKQPYNAERRFLLLARDVACAPVDLADLSAAHFSYRSSRTKARLHVAQALGFGLNEVFPEYDGQAWELINAGYNEQPHRDAKSKFMGRLLTAAQIRLSAESLTVATA